MESQTVSTIQSIKRKLAIEVMITIPMLIGAYFFTKYLGHNWATITWITLILLTFTGHIWLYLSLEEQESAEEANKTKIKFFLSLCHPILMCINTIILYEELHNNLMEAIICAGILSLLLYFPLKWYLNTLYEKHYATFSYNQK